MTFIEKLAADITNAALEKLAEVSTLKAPKKKKRNKKSPYTKYLETGSQMFGGAVAASMFSDAVNATKTKILDTGDSAAKKVLQLAGVI